MIKKIFVFFLAFCLFFSGCSLSDMKKEQIQFFAMDTVIDISVYGKSAEDVLKATEKEVNRLNALFSISNTNSDIYKINNRETSSVSQETAEIIASALEVYEETGGAFDITVYPIVEAWGFYSGDYSVPEKHELDELLKLIGSDKVSLEGDAVNIPEGMKLDLGGIAKGYTSLKIAELIKECGVKSAVISIGGNVHVVGRNPNGRKWEVAIQDPHDKTKTIGMVAVEDEAVVTSGGYQRKFEENGIEYHHIIDPRTGETARTSLASVTIISRDDMLADALSTAIFVMGKEKASEFWRENADKFDIIFVTDSGEIFVTAGIADEFKSYDDYEVLK